MREKGRDRQKTNGKKEKWLLDGEFSLGRTRIERPDERERERER